jgi:hypothetical protein
MAPVRTGGPASRLNAAVTLHKVGKPAEAEEIYRGVEAQAPATADSCTLY